MKTQTYHAIGIMSGSSLDGVDFVYVRFTHQNDVPKPWTYEILHTFFVPYPDKWQVRLANLPEQTALTYLKTHTFYGHYLGELVNRFVGEKNISKVEIDFVASHGHTIFHYPENRFTGQIGDGAAIATVTGLKTITNFRNSDVAIYGQGAPIVPIGDRYLFSDYRFCLNLGGIANISCMLPSGESMGYDICGVNQILNRLAHQLELDFDEGGKIAKGGQLDKSLLEALSQVNYYQQAAPKSLSNSWVGGDFYAIFSDYDSPIANKLNTMVEHVAIEIAREIAYLYTEKQVANHADDKLLVTGGGALNDFLIERMAHHLAPLSVEVVVPDDCATVDYKEALIMAFVGALRVRGEANCLHSVTGAKFDTCNGAIYSGHV